MQVLQIVVVDMLPLVALIALARWTIRAHRNARPIVAKGALVLLIAPALFSLQLVYGGINAVGALSTAGSLSPESQRTLFELVLGEHAYWAMIEVGLLVPVTAWLSVWTWLGRARKTSQ